jgi:hypothetical protein
MYGILDNSGRTPLLAGVSVLIFRTNIRVAKYTLCDVISIVRFHALPDSNALFLTLPVSFLASFVHPPSIYARYCFALLSRFAPPSLVFVFCTIWGVHMFV